MNISSRNRPKLPSAARVATLALGLALASLPDSALAAPSKGRAAIHFSFLAGTTQCPPGTYEFEVDGTKVTLRSTDPKGATAILLVITRLGRHDKDKDPEFVFDKRDEQLKLSEIWLPGQDGYLMLITAEDHAHRVVGGSNPHD